MTTRTPAVTTPAPLTRPVPMSGAAAEILAGILGDEPPPFGPARRGPIAWHACV